MATRKKTAKRTKKIQENTNPAEKTSNVQKETEQPATEIVKYALGELQGDKDKQDKLVELEERFKNGIATVCDMGAALTEIRDGGYYHARGYATFEAYVKKFFEISRAYAYRLINHNRVRGLIGIQRDVKITESYLRQLATIHDNDDVQRIWNEAKGDSAELPSIEVLSAKVIAFKESQREERHSNDDYSVDLLFRKAKENSKKIPKLYEAYSKRIEFETAEKKKILKKLKELQAKELEEFKEKLGI